MKIDPIEFQIQSIERRVRHAMLDTLLDFQLEIELEVARKEISPVVAKRTLAWMEEERRRIESRLMAITETWKAGDKDVS